jgi:hypothetical protein
MLVVISGLYGREVERYNFSSNAWKEAEPTIKRRSNFAVTTHGDFLLICGGNTGFDDKRS